MELFIKTIFWIATLNSFLHAKPVYSICGDLQTDSMRTEVKCPSDSEFYAPENVEDKCITTALDCIRGELHGTVRSECNDKGEYINDGVRTLQNMINQTLVNNTECPCERWPTTSFSKFLNKMEELCQRITSQIASAGS